MKLKPIKNDRELSRVLKRIDELWGAKPNTPKGDELDVLMLLKSMKMSIMQFPHRTPLRRSSF